MTNKPISRAVLAVFPCLALTAVAAHGDEPKPASGDESYASAEAFPGRSQRQRPASPQVRAQTAASLEEVVITGSRIARDPNLGSIAPVQTVTGEELRTSGEPDLVDILDDIPALLSSVTPSQSRGASVLELRSLGIERTLTLVNGRRHVGGVAGSASVDVGSIPKALIERVDVLTGGASSIYGADAVTGVVNFVLRDNFEGLRFDLNGAGARRGEAGELGGSGAYGFNFAKDRGNFAVAFDYSRRENLRNADRRFTRNNNTFGALANPDLRFQEGDISAEKTPNFARFFSREQMRFPTGFQIPSADAFTAAFTEAFGSAPVLTAKEMKLIRRAAKAPANALRPGSSFAISSKGGVIAPADFNDRGTDLDGNGVNDCNDSFVGFMSSNALGGCFVIDGNGKARPYQDGLIASPTNQFRGDGSENSLNEAFITPDDHRFTINFLSHYDLTESMTLFGEAKYSFSRSETANPANTFYDLLTVAPDNPFIPNELKDLATQAGGLFITRDPTDLGRNEDASDRHTYRFVGGVKGKFFDGWDYELAGNYGKFVLDTTNRNAVIQDRFFAAIDVVTGPDGKPHCRSDFSTTPPPTTPFDIPLFDSGFFTFRPGDGKCKPANLLNGRSSISPEAVDFITQTTKSQTELNQLVFSAVVSGNSERWFSLPGGPLAFSFGGEYRDEKSTSRFDPLTLGVLPVDGPSGKAGQLISKVDGVRQKGLVFDPGPQIRNDGGDFRVKDLFAEVSLPLLRNTLLADELTFDAAARYSDYSTIGNTFTYNFGLSWAPIQDIRFRSTFAEAVRAPNIDELFSPDQGAVFRPADPCDQGNLDALRSVDKKRADQREKNCRAAGIPVGFTDPLTARFTGVTSGNRNLKEETADTFTAGFVLQPRFLSGVSFSLDYFDIDIDDAIAAIGAQDIVDACFDSPTFPGNQNCSLFSRNMDPNSPQFLGFNFLRQTELNFAALQTSGFDFGVAYNFGFRDNDIRMSVTGTKVNHIDVFFDPTNPGMKDRGVGEVGQPEWAGNFNFNWRRGSMSVGWQTQYLDKQTIGDIETAQQNFGRAAKLKETYIHDLTFSWDFAENRYRLFGGVNNVTGEQPFNISTSFPVSPIGRLFFMGLRVNY